MTALTFVVLALASFRLTRLIVRDDITAPLRDRTSGWFEELVTCHWCASAYVSAGVVALSAGPWSRLSIPQPGLVWLAVWAAAALISEWADG